MTDEKKMSVHSEGISKRGVYLYTLILSIMEQYNSPE